MPQIKIRQNNKLPLPQAGNHNTVQDPLNTTKKAKRSKHEISPQPQSQRTRNTGTATLGQSVVKTTGEGGQN